MLLVVSRYHNLASSNPTMLKTMQDTLTKMNAGFFDPDRNGGDAEVPIQAALKYGGFWGPFLP